MTRFLLLAALVLLGTSFIAPKPIKWVAIGDSITYLNDHPNETGNRVSKGYLTRVTDKLPNVQYVNQGHNGWKSTDIAQKIDSLGLVKADVYSVFLGTNDWWHGTPVGSMADYTGNTGTGTVYGSFRIIMNKIRSLNAAAKIILITPMQRGDFVYLADMKNNAYGSYKAKNGQYLKDVADAVAAIAVAEHAELVDLYNKKGMSVKDMVKFKRLKDPVTGVYRHYTYPDYTNIAFNPETDEYPYPPEAINITYDGLHPSDEGNAMIAGLLVEIMKND